MQIAFAGRRRRQVQHLPADGEAPHPDRLDAAPAHPRGEGRLRAGAGEKVWPLIAAGKVKVVIDSTFPLAKAADAHRRIETSEHVGKIVLVV